MKLLVHALIGVFKVLLYVRLLKETTMAGKMKRKVKGAVKSKTVWGNVLAGGAAVLDFALNNGQLIGMIGGGPGVAVGMAALNVFLRGITNEPLEYKAD